jgi:hypothetical protein
VTTRTRVYDFRPRDAATLNDGLEHVDVGGTGRPAILMIDGQQTAVAKRTVVRCVRGENGDLTVEYIDGVPDVWESREWAAVGRMEMSDGQTAAFVGTTREDLPQ